MAFKQPTLTGVRDPETGLPLEYFDRRAYSRDQFARDPLSGEKLAVIDDIVPISISQGMDLASDYADDPEARQAIAKQFGQGLFASNARSAPQMPTADAILGKGIKSPLSGIFAGNEEVAGAMLQDFGRRQAMGPVAEVQALFNAFGKGGDLTSLATKGALGQDIVGRVAQAKAAKKLEARQIANDQFVKEILKDIAKKK